MMLPTEKHSKTTVVPGFTHTRHMLPIRSLTILVKEKRILWKTLLTIFDLAVYLTLVGIFVLNLIDKEYERWYLGLIWIIISVIMSIALCVAL